MGLLENTIGAMIGRPSGEASGPSPSQSGASPYGVLATALIGLLAAKAATGGFGDLGGLMGGKKTAGTQPVPQPAPNSSMTTDAGGGLLGGLGGLFHQFQQNGHGQLVNSWVGSGQNQPPTPTQVTQALDPDTIRQLAQKTGMSEEEVAARLSQELPHVVDKLTPQGRMPTNDEISAWR